ncbi:hypothetical protein BH11PSE11_BH11PSE11_26730 [soil metagenome]
MINHILDKTDKGREEIATRKHHLAPRLRTLLLLIDGKKSTDDVLNKVSGLGLTHQNITELLDGGFIQIIISAPNASSNKVRAPAPETIQPIAENTHAALTQNNPAPVAEVEKDERRGSGLPSANATTIPRNRPVPTEILRDNENQFQAIYNFYTVTIKGTMGLRAYALQQKVERANTIEDFRELRLTYLEAVYKAKGEALTRTLRDRLDQLLYLGEMPPPPTTIINMDIDS